MLSFVSLFLLFIPEGKHGVYVVYYRSECPAVPFSCSDCLCLVRSVGLRRRAVWQSIHFVLSLAYFPTRYMARVFSLGVADSGEGAGWRGLFGPFDGGQG